MNDLETKVVDLIEGGLTRWKIAEELGLGETSVRGVIRNLCEQYQCSMRDLPQAIREQEERDNSSVPQVSEE